MSALELDITKFVKPGKNSVEVFCVKSSAKSQAADLSGTMVSRQYAMGQSHKHLPEMAVVCGLENDPIFCPIVADFYSGMEVTVPLFARDIKGSPEDIKALYKAYYAQGLIHYDEEADADGLLSAAAYAGKDDMGVSVFGNRERIILTARFDNLGKGASGAAIQNMNILLGLDEATGLNV
jgi:N-acetyl-gamma-glutamyl-phosphate reductase